VGDGLPLQITSAGWRSQTVRLRGDTSSQFLSGLLLAAPVAPDGLRIELTSELVSEPYVDMTIAVMRRFGAVVHRPEHAVFVVESGGYRATPYVVEPDASAASYPWAAAALCGGSVTVADLGTDSVQGDVRFVDVLEAMGAVVDRHPDRITVHGAALHGVETDLADISDTAPTFAVVAALAEGPSRATGIGFIRAKESDRVGAVVAELVRCGVGAVVEADGFAITPSRGRIGPAIVETYGDHRMAMAFALLGLAGGDVTIHDPGCVAKTFPGYWMLLDELRASAVPGQ
jgi:3-phosphoshikimate 1-carboxyvinyltransferase